MNEINVVPQHGGGFGVIREAKEWGPNDEGMEVEFQDGTVVLIQRLAVFGTEEEAEAYRDEVRKEWT